MHVILFSYEVAPEAKVKGEKGKKGKDAGVLGMADHYAECYPGLVSSRCSLMQGYPGLDSQCYPG